MADFSNFKVGSTSYKVKDAAAGKSLSISGTDLSLKNAAGTVISTVTLPSDTIYKVEVKYTDTTVTGQASDSVTPMKAGTGTWSITIDPALPAGKTLFDVNRVFVGIVSFPNADSGYQYHCLYNTSTNYNYVTFGVEDDNLTHSIGALLTLYIYADGTVMEWGWTDLSSGGGASPVPDAIIGSIAVDMTGQNITTSSFSAATGTILVDDMAKLRLSVKCPQGWPTDVGSLSPIACRVKTGNGGPVYDTIKDAIDHSAAGNISSIVLYYEWKAGSWISVSINAAYNNGSLTITGGSAATASTLIQ